MSVIDSAELRDSIIKDLRASGSQFPELQIDELIKKDDGLISIDISAPENSYGSINFRYPIHTGSPMIQRILEYSRQNNPVSTQKKVNDPFIYLVCQGQFTPDGTIQQNFCQLRNRWMFALDVPLSDRFNYTNMETTVKNSIARAITAKIARRRGLH